MNIIKKHFFVKKIATKDSASFPQQAQTDRAIQPDPAVESIVSANDERLGRKFKEFFMKSREAFDRWSRTSFSHRSALMKNAAALLRIGIGPQAELMAREMGKPVKDGRAEVEKCAWVCDYFAEKAEAFLSPEPVETDAGKSFVSFSPLRVVMAIMKINCLVNDLVRSDPRLPFGGVKDSGYGRELSR